MLEAGTTYWIELGTWRPDPPWAPPPNSPYQFNISIPGAPTPTSCDGTGIATVLVGDPGNAADTNGAGSVADVYRVSKHEVSNAQYVKLLNSVAAADPNGLFNQDMTDSDRGGIIRGGTSGTFVYWVKASFGDKPVNFITWLDAARYCNWLHNGQPVGPQNASTTEHGAYDLSLADDLIARLPGARWFIPTHDEWYKAAYYDPVDPGADGGGTPNYWSYPTRSDTLPTQATADAVGNVANPGVNVANFGGGADWNGENGNVTTVGSATSTSPWGGLDMGGNVLDWTETPDTPIPGPPPLPTRTARGGDFSNSGILMSSSSGFALAINMVAEAANVGFRVAAVLCPGDFDGDNDVDEDDSDAFESCFTGPGGGPVGPGCGPGDFDDDGDIDCDDWALFVAAWTALGDPPTLCFCNPADINGDGTVNVLDLIDLLLCFGLPAVPGCEPEDVNGDGTVNVLDLIELLLVFGQSCP
jgi:formylglycine-generating enzyme required for sulfatase activity